MSETVNKKVIINLKKTNQLKSNLKIEEVKGSLMKIN
jgi:hypothetical protein